VKIEDEIEEVDDSVAASVRAAMMEHGGDDEDDDTEEAAPKSDRDKHGRFAKSEAEEEEPAEVEEPAAEQEQQALSVDRAPASWTPAMREKWGSLDPDIRGEIIRREEASMHGVRHLQEQYQPLQQMNNDLRPYIEQAFEYGFQPSQYITGALKMQNDLNAETIPERFQALLRIADDFGIPLRDVINESVGQQVLEAPSQMRLPPEIQSQLAEIQGWRQQQEQNQTNYEISNFANHPEAEFFEDVRHKMADLIDAGLAEGLVDAYQQAIWIVPEVRQVLMARQGQQSQAGAVQQRQKAAAGVSPRGGGKIAVADSSDADDDLSDTIRKAFQAQQGRM